MNWVARTAAALIAVQLVVRAVLAFRGYFYWDDLILTGRAGTQDLLSPAYLFDDHDGHVMPGAFLVAGGITRLAPLNWIGPAISLVVLQLLASLALLRALHVILGWRPVLLLPLTFALFTPLGVPAFAWWAAALNSLPMLAALAWVCADAVLLVRTGNQRYAVTGLLVYFGGLLFFEKAAVIPFVAFTIAALYAHVSGSGSVAEVWRRGVSAVGIGAGGDGGVDRRLSGRGRSEAVELRRGDDVGSVEPLGDSWDRAGFGWRTVGLAALGPGITVGDAAGGGDGFGMGGAGGRGGDLVHAQGTDRAGVAGGRRVRGRVPDPDLPDALVAVHRARAGADAALPAGPCRGVGAAARRRPVRAEPRTLDVVGCFADADGGNRFAPQRHSLRAACTRPRRSWSAGVTTRPNRICRTPRRDSPPRVQIRMHRFSIRRSIRWCCSGWRRRRISPATCSHC